jgi:2-deoxy-D-gluconate 3-dehydrogenase
MDAQSGGVMILDKFKLDGKTAVVTGAARGLGQAIAVALAEAGADVALVDLIPLDETHKCIQALDRRSVMIQKDLSKKESIEPIIRLTVKALRGIDILVNNAGIIRRAPFTEFSEEDWNEVIAINQSAMFFLSQAVVRQMISQNRGGKIINIASLLSFQGGIFVPSYTASKSAVMGLTRLMANELALKGINVNAIAPGYMSTENTRPLREDEARAKTILDRIPAGRWGVPEDLQGAAVFLASDASSYMHGYTIAVDGGWLAR